MPASVKTGRTPTPHGHMTKKCPECFAHLPLDAKVCDACGRRVGAVNRIGLAETPPNIKGYVLAGIAILAFLIFVWWGFFNE